MRGNLDTLEKGALKEALEDKKRSLRCGIKTTLIRNLKKVLDF